MYPRLLAQPSLSFASCPPRLPATYTLGSRAQCMEGLTCFQRDGTTPVPGCLSDGVGTDGCALPGLSRTHGRHTPRAVTLYTLCTHPPCIRLACVLFCVCWRARSPRASRPHSMLNDSLRGPSMINDHPEFDLQTMHARAECLSFEGGERLTCVFASPRDTRLERPFYRSRVSQLQTSSCMHFLVLEVAVLFAAGLTRRPL